METTTHTKLTTPEQIAALKQGDHLTKFPTNGPPELNFDDTVKKKIDTYEIQSINKETTILGLAMAGSSLLVFPMPVDIGRLFISKENLLLQEVWWI